MLTNVNIIMNHLGVNYNKLFLLEKHNINILIKDKDGVSDNRIKVVKELLETKELQSFNFLNTRKITDILNYE